MAIGESIVISCEGLPSRHLQTKAEWIYMKSKRNAGRRRWKGGGTREKHLFKEKVSARVEKKDSE